MIQFVTLGNFSSFMQKEIFEQPESVVNTMRGRVNFDDYTGNELQMIILEPPVGVGTGRAWKLLVLLAWQKAVAAGHQQRPVVCHPHPAPYENPVTWGAPRIVRCQRHRAGGRSVVTRDRESVSVWEDEKVLGMDDSNGCPTVWTGLMPWSCTVHLTMVNVWCTSILLQ